MLKQMCKDRNTIVHNGVSMNPTKIERLCWEVDLDLKKEVTTLCEHSDMATWIDVSLRSNQHGPKLIQMDLSTL